MQAPDVKTLCLGVLFLLTLVSGLVLGYSVGKEQWSMQELLWSAQDKLYELRWATVDSHGRLVAHKGKQGVDCPQQTERVGVLLFVGQSNVANHASHRYPASEQQNVYNYFGGECFLASSPLLGATGLRGEWVSGAAQALVDQGTYDEVVVISAGIAGSSVTAWAAGNHLNQLLTQVLEQVASTYQITDIIWHQGESDYGYTFASTYRAMFLSLVETLRSHSVDAPIFLSTASLCDGATDYPSPIASAQQDLARLPGIELGVNTDLLVKPDMRYDGCHFDRRAQALAGSALADIIGRYRHSSEAPSDE